MRQATAEPATTETRFLPVPVDSLDAQTMQMDLYIKTTSRGNPTLYRSAGLEFTEDDRRRLIDQRVEFLYINAQQHAAYRRSLTARLERSFSDKTVAAQERARIIRASCTRMIEDVMLLPAEGEPVQAIFDIGNNFAAWSERDPRTFSYFLDMSAHDFYTTTHMVNVGVGCGLVVKQMHPGDEPMFAVAVQGGMLHDIGKRDIAEEILEKEGKLSDEEFNLLRQHPLIGYEELRQNPSIPAAILEMVRDHHERLDGTGYPNQLAGAKISYLARVCAVVDVFDSITASRPNRPSTPPREALEIMRAGRGSQFDQKVFDAWEGIVNQMLKEDPKRAPAEAKGTIPRTLETLMATGTSPRPLQSAVAASGSGYLDRDEAELWKKNRRRHERFDCRTQVRTRFLTQGKSCDVAPCQVFMATLCDISRGGVSLLCKHPMTINDLIEVELPHPKGPMQRRCRVVRVRQPDSETFLIGMRFCEAE